MKMNLRKSIAALVPVLGVAAMGAVSAQVVDLEPSPPVVTQERTTTPALEANETVVLAEPAQPVAVAQNTVAPREAYREETYRTVVPGTPLPPAASRLSGRNSGEEIATRTMPIDVRAQLFPEYLTDHSPGV